MDKQKIIEAITNKLEAASAVQCDVVLTFVESMTKGGGDPQPGGTLPASRWFRFTEPEAIEAAEIVSRNQGNGRLTHEILIHARAFEKACGGSGEAVQE